MTAIAERFNKSTAATYLGVSERTLDLWRSQDRGPRSHKIGGRLYWLKTDCDHWLTVQLRETAHGGVR
jgi:predicted DNA-binding transcriptional regulator AlpA